MVCNFRERGWGALRLYSIVVSPKGKGRQKGCVIFAYRMALTQGLDVEECKDALGFEELE